jgi:hypothetical protein
MSTRSYLARRAIYQNQHQDEASGGKAMQSPGYPSSSPAGSESLRGMKPGAVRSGDTGRRGFDAETVSPV